MSPDMVSTCILWRVWTYLFTHPDWTSRTDSLALVTKLRFEFSTRLTQAERDEVFAQIDHLRMLEVI